MSNKIKLIDPIVIIGVIISTAIALILVLIGQDQSISLLIGLVLTAITLLIDVIARIKESEETIIQASTLEITLIQYPILFSTTSQIAQDYATVTKHGFDFFIEKANDTIMDCRDIMHGLSEGRMIEDIDRVKVSLEQGVSATQKPA